MNKAGSYSHLNEHDTAAFSIPDVAETIHLMNYGDQRLLSELLRLREESEDNKNCEDYSRHTAQLRAMLDQGWY